MGIFEKWLTVWVLLCMGAGLFVAQVAPTMIHALGNLEIAHVNLPIAMLIWLMVIPMFMKVDLKEINQISQHWRGMVITLFINWLVKPFSMAFLGWIFIKHVFVHLLPAAQLDYYMAGLILLAAAPCTAMVFVWSHLAKGNVHFTLAQVALNDIIMVFAFAPIVGLLLGVSNIMVPWSTLLLSVLIYVVIPLIIAQSLRHFFQKKSQLDHVLKSLNPVSMASLLIMLVLLFGFQGEVLIHKPIIVLLLAIPILIQVYFNSGLAFLLNKLTGEPDEIAGPSALIGASNFFELSVAAAVSIFGFHSGATLATVVGVLVEVPVMLSVVALIKRRAVHQEHQLTTVLKRL